MATQFTSPALVDQAWFNQLLESFGFRREESSSFSNGRASLRLDGTRLTLVPGDGTNLWRSELKGVPREALRHMLTTVLSTPAFQSQAELDRRKAIQTAAEEALTRIGEAIGQEPDSSQGVHLRRFVWTLFNGHHALNLWQLRDSLGSTHNALVTEVFTAWMQGFLPEGALRKVLKDSGEMDRWDHVRIGPPHLARVVAAVDAVTDTIDLIQPGPSSTDLNRANDMLHQALDSLRKISRR